MSILIIPCLIRTKWDIKCLQRLLISVENQSKPFDKVYLIEDASPFSYTLPFNFIEHIKLSYNGGPARARNIGIDKALALIHNICCLPTTTAFWTNNGMSK